MDEKERQRAFIPAVGPSGILEIVINHFQNVKGNFIAKPPQ